MSLKIDPTLLTGFVTDAEALIDAARADLPVIAPMRGTRDFDATLQSLRSAQTHIQELAAGSEFFDFPNVTQLARLIAESLTAARSAGRLDTRTLATIRLGLGQLSSQVQAVQHPSPAPEPNAIVLDELRAICAGLPAPFPPEAATAPSRVLVAESDTVAESTPARSEIVEFALPRELAATAADSVPTNGHAHTDRTLNEPIPVSEWTQPAAQAAPTPTPTPTPTPPPLPQAISPAPPAPPRPATPTKPVSPWSMPTPETIVTPIQPSPAPAPAAHNGHAHTPPPPLAPPPALLIVEALEPARSPEPADPVMPAPAEAEPAAIEPAPIEPAPIEPAPIEPVLIEPVAETAPPEASTPEAAPPEASTPEPEAEVPLASPFDPPVEVVAAPEPITEPFEFPALRPVVLEPEESDAPAPVDLAPIAEPIAHAVTEPIAEPVASSLAALDQASLPALQASEPDPRPTPAPVRIPPTLPIGFGPSRPIERPPLARGARPPATPAPPITPAPPATFTPIEPPEAAPSPAAATPAAAALDHTDPPTDPELHELNAVMALITTLKARLGDAPATNGLADAITRAATHLDPPPPALDPDPAPRADDLAEPPALPPVVEPAPPAPSPIELDPIAEADAEIVEPPPSPALDLGPASQPDEPADAPASLALDAAERAEPPAPLNHEPLTELKLGPEPDDTDSEPRPVLQFLEDLATKGKVLSVPIEIESTAPSLLSEARTLESLRGPLARLMAAFAYTGGGPAPSLRLSAEQAGRMLLVRVCRKGPYGAVRVELEQAAKREQLGPELTALGASVAFKVPAPATIVASVEVLAS